MKKALIIAGVLILFLVTAQVSFRYGVAVQTRNIGRELSSTQAMIWFHHLQSLQEIEGNMAEGCHEVALENVRIAIDEQMMLLSRTVKEDPGAPIVGYMSSQDPAILGKLSNFKSRHGDSWVEPQCVKSTSKK